MLGAMVLLPVRGALALLLALLPDSTPLTAEEPPLLAVLPRAPLLKLAAIATVKRKKIDQKIINMLPDLRSYSG
jgi:hypothetical protein